MIAKRSETWFMLRHWSIVNLGKRSSKRGIYSGKNSLFILRRFNVKWRSSRRGVRTGQICHVSQQRKRSITINAWDFRYFSHGRFNKFLNYWIFITLRRPFSQYAGNKKISRHRFRNCAFFDRLIKRTVWPIYEGCFQCHFSPVLIKL